MKENIKRLYALSSMGSRLGLDSIKALLQKMGNPQNKLKVVHVAGTNGKGSTIAFLEKMSCAAKVKVGAYTSPCLEVFTENIRVNGKEILESEADKLLKEIFVFCDEMVKEGIFHPTKFEVETALAFYYFEKQQCELVLLETGLGGKEDATNVVDMPFITLLTSIGLDHCNELGESIEEITKNECGILKEGTLFVAAPQQESIINTIKQCANEKNISCTFAQISELDTYEVKFLASYQADNAALAIAAARILGFEYIHILQGLQQAEWFGRFSVIRKNPLIILDGAHNPPAIEQLCETLKKQYLGKKKIFITAIYRDKDIKTMLQSIGGLADKVILFGDKTIQRLADINDLCCIAKECGLKFACASSPVDALRLTLKQDLSNSVVVVCGSLSILKPIQKAFLSLKDSCKKFNT
ncbi:MAG: Mur ligase family protein [Firmicutes bacterium]|nr:Mur ligase family protein [Bacillota bacterium]